MKISFSVWKVWTFWTFLSSIFNKEFEFWTKSVYTWVINKKINLNFWCPFQYCGARYQEILWANTQKKYKIYSKWKLHDPNHITVWVHIKVEKILKGSLNLIPSPLPSVKIQIMGRKVCLRCKGKTMPGVVSKLLKTKSLLTLPSNVLPYYLK